MCRSPILIQFCSAAEASAHSGRCAGVVGDREYRDGYATGERYLNKERTAELIADGAGSLITGAAERTRDRVLQKLILKRLDADNQQPRSRLSPRIPDKGKIPLTGLVQ